MRKAILIILVAIIASCNSGDEPEMKAVFKPHADTARMWGTYVELPTKKIAHGEVVMVKKNVIIVDSFLNATQRIDTIVYIKPSYDTTGKFFLTMPSSVSLATNVDTALITLTRWIKENEKLFPKDTTIKK